MIISFHFQDQTFTCTLFMPYDIFEGIKTEVRKAVFVLLLSPLPKHFELMPLQKKLNGFFYTVIWCVSKESRTSQGKLTLKSKTFGQKTFGRKLRTKNFRTLFREFQTKNFRKNTTSKNKHYTKLYVKNNCDSIMNINLQ